jgi:secreted PhoX family phosphatase
LNADSVGAQERQFGTNADAVAYFAQKSGRAARGLVCVNHEYVNAELIWPGHRGAGMKADARKEWMDRHPHAVEFMQVAHGVSVMQLYRDEKGWTRDLSARENRRITARTPIDICGPARATSCQRTPIPRGLAC